MNYIFIFNNFINWIEINYLLSLFLFFIFILFYSIFSLPGLIIFFLFSGYVFGIFISYLICIVSFSLGSLCFFIISKYILSKLFIKYYAKYTNKINKFIKNSTLEYLIIFRLIPGTPLMVQNILLSLLDISSFRFILSTSIGATPFILFSILIGNKLNNIDSLKNYNSKDIFTVDLLIILFVIIFFITIRIIYKKK